MMDQRKLNWIFLARFEIFFLVVGVFFLSVLPARALILFDYSVSAKPVVFINGLPGNRYTFSWTAPIDVASTTAKNFYTIYAASGNASPLTQGTTAAFVFDATGITLDLSAHTYSFLIRASNTVSGIFAETAVTVHWYQATEGCTGDGGVKRVDSAGTQIGMGQQWKFTYSLLHDSELVMRIYSPATTFSLDSMGFPQATGNPAPVKTLVDGAPRSGALASCSVSNEEIWDSRNSSGSLVTNGIYFVHFLARHPLLGGATLFAGVQTVPVDILRFTKFNTVGISANSSLGSISYTLNGDATVRILIAKPGRQLVIDSNGDIQSLNSAGTTVDTTTNSVVTVLAFNRQAGSYTESWNGTDQNSVSVSSGLYVVGISATDAFGNRAVSLSGDDGPTVGSIPVDRTASQTATDTTAPTVSSAVVGGTQISLAGGTALTGSISTLVVSLSETAGTGANAPTVTLTDPSGSSVAGTASISGTDITFTPSTALSSTGTYTLAVTPRDTSGNTGSATSITFVIQSASSSGGGGGAAGTSAEIFRNSVYAYPNPAKAAPVNIAFTLSNPANLEFDVFNILGERVYHQVFNGLVAGAQTINWSLVNEAATKIGSGVYVYRLRSVGGSESLEAVKKVMVIQ